MAKGSQPLRVRLQIPRSFCRYYPVKDKIITIEASPGTSVADLIKQAGLPEFEFGIVIVRGKRELLSYQPTDGETIELLPIISGGCSPNPTLQGRCLLRPAGQRASPAPTNLVVKITVAAC